MAVISFNQKLQQGEINHHIIKWLRGHQSINEACMKAHMKGKAAEEEIKIMGFWNEHLYIAMVERVETIVMKSFKLS